MPRCSKEGRLNQEMISLFRLFLILFMVFLSACGQKITSSTTTPISIISGEVETLVSGAGGSEPEVEFPPAVASETGQENNRTLVVWEQDEKLQGIITSGETVVESPFTLVAAPSDSNIRLDAPTLTYFSGGKFLLVWERGRLVSVQGMTGNIDAKRLVAQVFDQSGTAITQQLDVDERSEVIAMVESGAISSTRESWAKNNNILGQGAREAEVDWDRNQTAWITWASDDKKVYGRGFRGTNFLTSAEAVGEISTTAIGGFEEYLPSIGVTENGNSLVVWQELPDYRGDTNQAPNGFPNYGTRVDPSGKKMGDDIRIDQAAIPRIPDFPGVLGLSSGWLVAWKDSDANDKTFEQRGETRPEEVEQLMQKVDSKLYVAFLNSAGNQLGEALRLDTVGKVLTTPGQVQIGQHSRRAWRTAIPDFIQDSQGNIFCGWTDYRSGSAEVYGRVIASDYKTLSSEFKVGTGYNPRITYDGTNFLVIWTSINTQGGSSSIYLRSYKLQVNAN